MNKKLTSLLLAFLMVFSMLATAVPAYAVSPEPAITVSVKADKSTADPGDTITYQVFLGAVNNWADAEFTVVIPDGLTYVSATVSDTVSDHFEGGWTASTKKFVVYTDTGYSSASDTLLLTVVCTVNDSAAGTSPTVSLFDPFFCDINAEDYVMTNSNPSATVTITAPHTHTYDQEKATAEYLKTPATCTKKAVYWKSCTCGAASDTLAFEYGNKDLNNHTGTAKWTKTADKHSQAYDCCDAVVVPEASHTWVNGKCSVVGCGYECQHTGGTATCKDKAVCTECGESYGSLNANNHVGTLKWTKTATTHKQAYDGCGHAVVTETNHNKNAHAYNATHHWEKCDVCGYEFSSVKVAHKDDNKDYKCDTCDYQLSRPSVGGHYSHFDHNNDGKCDYCSVKINCKHTDANKDGFCDSCSAKTVESSETFDAGIALYAGMAVLAATGSAVVIGKKRKD